MRHRSALSVLWAAVACAAMAAAAVQTNQPAAFDPQTINQVLGVPLFADTCLWNDDADTVAGRLRLPLESRTSYQSSYRAYPDAAARILGARPYSVVLYGDTGVISSVSIVFANKGDVEGLSSGGDRKDTKATSSERKKALREYGDQIKKDTKTIRAALEAALGKPRNDVLGGSIREDVRRWDVGSHALLLAAPKDEYVALRIVPVAVVDEEVKGQRIPDKTLRDRLAKRVVRRDNGDVIITDIPMVDQGPKGFCVPATWERCLRYLGIPADMYLLAMAGGTGAGGGTSVQGMASSVEKLVKRAGRHIQRDKRKMHIRFIEGFIDKGIPVMWPMYVHRALYDELGKRMQQRQACTDMKAWKNALKIPRANARSLKTDPKNGHICMVVGYNRDTGELATSDSWGPEFAERWMTEEEADAIGSGELWSIAW